MGLVEELEQMANDWMNNWNASKTKIVQKLSEPDRQIKWKKNVLSPNAVQKRRKNLIEAIEAGLIEQGLEQVDPAQWAADTIQGVESTNVDTEDAEKWAKKVAPYMAVILQKKAEFDEKQLSGKEAMDWWYNNVSKKLHNMKLSKKAKEFIRQVEIKPM